MIDLAAGWALCLLGCALVTSALAKDRPSTVTLGLIVIVCGMYVAGMF